MDEIWGMFSETDERTVNTHINRLRDRFSDCTDFEIAVVIILITMLWLVLYKSA